MTDEKKLQGSKEIAVSGSDGEVHKVGGVQSSNRLPTDRIGESEIAVPLTVDLGDKIVTLSPSPRPVATTKDYISKVIWIATYKDGKVIAEYDEKGNSVTSEKIDKEKLRNFCLVDQRGRTVVSQAIQPGQCFFYRRRTALRTGEDVIEVIHIFGWRIKTKDDWITHAVFLFESDMHVEIGGFNTFDPDLSEAKQWKYPPKWRDIDEIPAV